MNKRLDILLRKNKEKDRQVAYRQVFLNSGIPEDELDHIAIEESDAISEKVSRVFANIEPRKETVAAVGNSVPIILKNVYDRLAASVGCYIYTTDVEFCGMFHTKAQFAVSCSIKVAKLDYQNLVFIVDEKFRYFLSIHYNDKDHIDEPLSFDVQLKEV